MDFGMAFKFTSHSLDDDPVREEHDIYLTKELADQLYCVVVDTIICSYLLQYPLRPKGRVYPEPTTVYMECF